MFVILVLSVLFHSSASGYCLSVVDVVNVLDGQRPVYNHTFAAW